MKNIISTILKGIGIALGVILLGLGGFMGWENLQASGTINIPIMLFSVAALLFGSMMLKLALKKEQNR